jgi:hypothetical protein
MNLLCWNARGLGSSKKRNMLHDLIIDHHVDIVAIQETKKQTFSTRILRSISTKLDEWFELPFVGLSGGILIECDSAKVAIERYVVL